jgi:hypothetical protein
MAYERVFVVAVAKSSPTSSAPRQTSASTIFGAAQGPGSITPDVLRALAYLIKLKVPKRSPKKSWSGLGAGTPVDPALARQVDRELLLRA